MEDRLSVHASNRWRTWSIILLAICFVAFYFMNAQAVAQGVRNGLTVCATILIPSLFPFMIVCSFLVNSRYIDALSMPLSSFTVRVLRLPPFMGAVFILSLIGGFPVGARMISDMYREGRVDVHTASRMLCFCVNAGPAFLITAVGSRMFGNTTAGVFLFCSQTFASIALALFSRIWAKKQEHTTHAPIRLNPFVPSFVSAVRNAADSMFTVCAFVTAFSAVVAFVDSSRFADLLHKLISFAPAGTAEAAINGLFEVTLGCSKSPAIGGLFSLYFACIICSFGGLSVMGQALSFFSGLPIKTLPYLLSRLIHMILSCGILFVLIKLFPAAVTVSSPAVGSITSQPFSGAPAASFALLILCFALILTKDEHTNV